MNKKPELNKMLKDMQNRIGRLQERMELAKTIPFDLVKQEFPEGHWWDTSYDWEFCMPFRFDLIQQAKEFCIDQGWTVKSERQHVWDDSAKAGHFFDVYIGRPFGEQGFGMAFRTSSEGDSCVLKQIGTKEVPVYEVVCQNGAEESW